MTLTKRLRPLVATLVLAALFSLAAACPAEQAACAATVSTTAVTPPEPITDGSYRDGAAEENEVAPEPVTDGSYRDGSLTEAEEEAEAPKKRKKPSSESDQVAQDDAQGC